MSKEQLEKQAISQGIAAFVSWHMRKITAIEKEEVLVGILEQCSMEYLERLLIAYQKNSDVPRASITRIWIPDEKR